LNALDNKTDGFQQQGKIILLHVYLTMPKRWMQCYINLKIPDANKLLLWCQAVR
jgi:hypothetical protein